MAKLYHPDAARGESDLTGVYEVGENFLIISEAYDVLSNEELREQYDQAYLEKDIEKMIIYDHPFAVSRQHAAR